MSADSGTWERDADRDRDAVRSLIEANLPDVMAMLDDGSAPPIRLLCPKGHRLLDVDLVQDHNGMVYVSPKGGDVDSSRGLVNPAMPGDGSARSVCHERGCPNLVAVGEGCPDHPTAGDDTTISGVRLRLRCHRCQHNGTYRQPALVKLVAAGIHMGFHEIRLPN